MRGGAGAGGTRGPRAGVSGSLLRTHGFRGQAGLVASVPDPPPVWPPPVPPPCHPSPPSACPAPLPAPAPRTGRAQGRGGALGAPQARRGRRRGWRGAHGLGHELRRPLQNGAGGGCGAGKHQEPALDPSLAPCTGALTGCPVAARRVGLAPGVGSGAKPQHSCFVQLTGPSLPSCGQVRGEDFSSYLSKLSTPRELLIMMTEMFARMEAHPDGGLTAQVRAACASRTDGFRRLVEVCSVLDGAPIV